MRAAALLVFALFLALAASAQKQSPPPTGLGAEIAVADLPAEARRDKHDHSDDRGEDHEREEHVEELLSGGHSDRHLPR